MKATPRGQGIVEYAIIISLIALVAMGSLAVLGGGVSGVFKHTLSAWNGEEAQATEHLEDDFEGHSDLKWECTNGWTRSWRKKKECESRWGGWRIKHGRMESRSWFSRAVSAVTGQDYTYAVDMQVRKTWWSRYFPHLTSRVVFRYKDSKNYYALIPRTDGTLVLAKRENGHWRNNLAYVHANIDPTQSHRYQIQVEGDRIKVWVDGKHLMTYKDPHPIPQGGIGVENYLSHSSIDNVEVDVKHSSHEKEKKDEKEEKD